MVLTYTSYLMFSIYCYSIAPTLEAQGGRLPPANKIQESTDQQNIKTKRKTNQISKECYLYVLPVSGSRYSTHSSESTKNVEERNA